MVAFQPSEAPAQRRDHITSLEVARMPSYCVNKNAQPESGDHEVHDLASTQNCLPAVENQLGLGYHPDCDSAVEEAKKHYDDVNGCFRCANPCHTT